jgi:hypothetical protein
MALIRRNYHPTHQRILQLVAALSDEQVAWQGAPTAPSIGFHLWHLARWADHLQAAIPGMAAELSQRLGPGEQIWSSELLATRWQLAGASFGFDDTGMGMDPTTPLALPSKAILLAYAERAFAAAEQAVDAIDDALFTAVEQSQPSTDGIRPADATVGAAILTHLVHENRHLGMLECLVGLQGAAGTATV